MLGGGAFCFRSLFFRRKLNQLYRRTVVCDHSRPNAFGWRTNRIDHFKTIYRLFDIIYFKGDMRNLFD